MLCCTLGEVDLTLLLSYVHHFYRSDNAQDIGEYVDAVVRGERPPSREIFTRTTSREYLQRTQSSLPARPATSHMYGSISRQSSMQDGYSRQSSMVDI